MAHPDMHPISFTYAPVASMCVITVHNLFLYSDLPLPCHPPSYWLRLFSSQTFSHINTPTFSNLVILHTYPPMKTEQTVCSETSAYKIQMPGNCPVESIHHHDNTCMGEEKDYNPEVTMHCNASKSGVWHSGQACEGINSYEINKVLAFETVPRCDWCCLC